MRDKSNPVLTIQGVERSFEQWSRDQREEYLKGWQAATVGTRLERSDPMFFDKGAADARKMLQSAA